MKCYLGYLAPFLEIEFFSISYNLEITQPGKPRKNTKFTKNGHFQPFFAEMLDYLLDLYHINVQMFL